MVEVLERIIHNQRSRAAVLLSSFAVAAPALTGLEYADTALAANQQSQPQATHTSEKPKQADGGGISDEAIVLIGLGLVLVAIAASPNLTAGQRASGKR